MSDDSPFLMPTLVCRECGRADEHTYCHPWLDGILLVMVLLAGAACVAMFVIGTLAGMS